MTKADLASDLEAARRGRYAITSRRGTRDAVSLDVAYELGQDLERERVSAGWRPAGWKLGFTNQALWSRLGLDRPIRARIYQETLCGADLDSAELVQPRIEPEIVVGFGADVPQMSDPEVIAAAVEWVAAGLEVVHCHFERWEMTPAEAVADAGVHAALAIGPRTQVNADVVRSLGAATLPVAAGWRRYGDGERSRCPGWPVGRAALAAEGPAWRPSRRGDRDHRHAHSGDAAPTWPALGAQSECVDRAGTGSATDPLTA
jgi:2-oxo-3-hexenedioate decarboxylase